MVGSKYFKSRGQKEIKEVMNKVKYKTEGYVTTITTDGYTAYENVVKKTFGWSNKKQGYSIKHNKITASKGEGFNIIIERLHNSIRERTKTFRDFHGSVESAEAIMKGYEIFYNFIRKHQGIDRKTPPELAIPEVDLSTNRWLSLIKLSKSNKI
jgi:transposase-like protein